MCDLPVYQNSLSGVQVEAVVESDDSDYTEGQVQLPPGSRSPQGPSESNQVRARRKRTHLNVYNFALSNLGADVPFCISDGSLSVYKVWKGF